MYPTIVPSLNFFSLYNPSYYDCFSIRIFFSLLQNQPLFSFTFLCLHSVTIIPRGLYVYMWYYTHIHIWTLILWRITQPPTCLFSFLYIFLTFLFWFFLFFSLNHTHFSSILLCFFFVYTFRTYGIFLFNLYPIIWSS